MDASETAVLVRRTLDGDTDAFAELYQATYKRIYFICTGFLRNQQDAEDMMQETYLTAYQRLHQLDEPKKFRSWLEQIAVNKCRNLLKKKVPVPVEEEMLLQTEETELDLPEEYILHQEKRHIIMKILREELSDLQYQTVLLYYFNQLSVNETAALMGCSENAVKNRLSVARSKIKSGVRQYEELHKDKLYSFTAAPFLTLLLSEEAKNTIVPALESTIFGEVTKLSAIGTTAKAISAAERMGRNMFQTRLLIGVGIAIIAAGSTGAILHLQKQMPSEQTDPASHTTEVISSEVQTITIPEESTETTPTASSDTAANAQETDTDIQTEQNTVSSLYDKGLEVIALMDEEIHNEEWIRLYSTSEIMKSEAFAKVRNSDYSVPEKVYRAVLPEENFSLLLDLMGADIDLSALSDALDDHVHTQFISGWVSALNAREGVEYAALSSIVKAQKIFVSSEITENCMYIYTFENACPVAVFYTVGDDGAVSASGQIILAESFRTDSEEEVAHSLLRMEELENTFELFRVEEIG